MFENYVKGIIGFYRESPLHFAVVDIFCFGEEALVPRLAGLIAVLCGMRSPESRSRAFRDMFVLLPPDLHPHEDALHAALCEEVTNTVTELYGVALSDAEREELEGQILLRHCSGLWVADSIEVVASLPENAVIIVLKAAHYRLEPVQAPETILPEGTVRTDAPVQIADAWVHHVVELAREVQEVAKRRSQYIVLDTAEYLPSDKAADRVLQSVEGTAVIGFASPDSTANDLAVHNAASHKVATNDPPASSDAANSNVAEALVANADAANTHAASEPRDLITESVARWRQLFSEGRSGEALREIDDHEELTTGHKIYLKVKMLDHAGLWHLAIDLIWDELENILSSCHPDSRIQMAMISVRAGEKELAERLLRSAYTEVYEQETRGQSEPWKEAKETDSSDGSDISSALRTQGSIENALEVASRLGNQELEDAMLKRLSKFFPNSIVILHQHIYQSVHRNDYGGLSQYLKERGEANLSDLAACFERVAAHLVVESPDYDALIGEVSATWSRLSTRVRLVCIRDASRRGKLRESIDLTLGLDPQSELAHDVAWQRAESIEQLITVYDVASEGKKTKTINTKDTNTKNTDSTNEHSRQMHSSNGHSPQDHSQGENSQQDGNVDPEQEWAAQALFGLIRQLLAYVARNHKDHLVRNRLNQLLEPQLTGMLGLSLLVSILADGIQSMKVDYGSTTPLPLELPNDESQVLADLRRLMEWLSDNEAVVLHSVQFPPGLFTVPVDILIPIVVNTLHEQSKSLGYEAGLRAYYNLLTLGIALARESRDSLRALDILRLGSATLVTAGYRQQARDMIEGVFPLADGDEKRLRFAWVCFADVYLRLGKLDEALLALDCAFSFPVHIGPEHAWVEIDLCIRILRQLHFVKEAQALIPVARQFLKEAYSQTDATSVDGSSVDATTKAEASTNKTPGNSESTSTAPSNPEMQLSGDYERRLDFLELSLRFQRIVRTQQRSKGAVNEDAGASLPTNAATPPPPESADQHRAENNIRDNDLSENSLRELLAIAESVRRHLQQAQEEADEIVPIALLLAHVTRALKQYDHTPPQEITQALDRALEQASEPYSSFIKTLTASDPSIDALIALYEQTEMARYSEDRAYDLNQLEGIARQVLDFVDTLSDPGETAIALELLSDHAMHTKSPHHSTKGNEGTSYSQLAQTGDFMKALSAVDIAVALVGLSVSGKLVRVMAQEGRLGPVEIETQDHFSIEKLKQWRQHYPRQYGLMEDTDNRFYLSMKNLQCLPPTSQRTLLVADTMLQLLPPNLLITKGRFIGAVHPIAVAPSLSWLQSQLAAPLQNDGSRSAWIPNATQGKTLKNLADSLNSVLEEHQIQLWTEPEIPVGLSGSEMVVVGAHGGLGPEEYFYGIGDDVALKIGGSDLVRAIGRASVVILFVCHGGRVDEHPAAHTTVGLVRKLLDGGCTAVIAPPWPLHWGVAQVWLPTFLEAWEIGMPVIDANFLANDAVAKATALAPGKYLAMTVYGNPFLTKSQM